jgi:EpsI family protein
MHKLRLFAPAAILGVGCVLLFGVHLQHPVRLERPLRSMPLKLAGAIGTDRDVSAAEQQVAGMSDYLFRIFRRDSVPLFSVYVGYYESQTTGRTIHSPKNCLPGAGWQALESGSRTLVVGGAPVTVNRYLLANGPARALVYYWYQGRGRVAHSEYRVKWDLLRDAARYGRSEEALVRVVVPIPREAGRADGISKAEEIARAAAAELIPRVEQVLPSWTRSGPRA